ncbi:MAG: aspartate carbamoyltransferase regulatory subunit [Oscillospiraceae bacterium]|nr:aspartate carbamoyltransferase regulatory subunit [Oscillospiraceae bacterium]MBR2484433.1 aspartate carbamoyltransferase regulatory subunit [Oscillospiraceae bacterium]
MIIGDIVNGIVIDHIKVGQSKEIYRALNLEALNCMVVMIRNADSATMGHKDVIKINTIVELDLDKLSYIAPGVTVSVIKDGKVAVSEELELPERLVNVVQCKNPRCITSVEQELAHEFRLANREKRIYRCIYCESEA